MASAARVQVGSADARHEGADQGLAGAGGWNVHGLDSDPARVDHDAPHAAQGDFLSRPPGFRPPGAGPAADDAA
jgi:hypothetical protein